MNELKQAFRPDVVAEAVKQPEFATIARRARRHRQNRAAAVASAAVAVVGVVAAIGWAVASPGGTEPVPVAGGETPFTEVGESVVAAYESSGMAYVRQFGFVPSLTDTLTVLTTEFPGEPGTYLWDGTFETEQQYEAVLAGNLRMLSIELPAGPAEGTLTFADGTQVRVPVVDAAAAFEAMHQQEPSCAVACPALTVTGASFGTAHVHLRSGVATAPAWLFTVEELKAPIARIAIAAQPSATTVLRTVGEVLGESQASWTHSIDDAAAVPGEPTVLELSFTGGACDVSRTAYAHESGDVVVVGIQIVSSGEVCIDIGIPSTTRITLSRPLGDRALLTVRGLELSVAS